MWLRTYSSTGLDGRILIRSAVSSGILPRSHERTRASLRLSMSISRPSGERPPPPRAQSQADRTRWRRRRPCLTPPHPARWQLHLLALCSPARGSHQTRPPPPSVRPRAPSPGLRQPRRPPARGPARAPDRRQIAHRPILPPPTAAARIPGCKSALARLPSDSGLPARSGPPRRRRRAIGRAGPSPRRTYADVHVYRRGRAGRGREREPHIPVVRNSDRVDEDAAVLPARTSPHATPARARRANDPARR